MSPLTHPMDVKSTVENVAVGRIIIDNRVQRAQLNRSKINKMVANFDENLLGTIVLSKRANGQYIALDGWHRSEACKIVPTAPTVMRAVVFENLTLEDEAHYFLGYNDRTVMHVVDTFNAEATKGVERALRIIEIVERHGAKVRTDSFAAVKAALRVVEYPNGYELLDRSFDIISSAWTVTNRKALDGRIVEGLAVFLHYYGDRVNVEQLKKRLMEVGELGHTDILKLAKPYYDAKGGRFVVAVCDVITGIYNKGRPTSNKLPDYQR